MALSEWHFVFLFAGFAGVSESLACKGYEWHINNMRVFILALPTIALACFVTLIGIGWHNKQIPFDVFHNALTWSVLGFFLAESWFSGDESECRKILRVKDTTN